MEGWPHAWVAAAAVPLVVGAVIARKALRAAREEQRELSQHDDR
jgi:hypothetical protein